MNIFKEIPLKGYRKTIPWIIVMMICMIGVPLIAHLSGNDDSGVIAAIISIFAMLISAAIHAIIRSNDKERA